MWTRGYGHLILEDPGATCVHFFYIPVTKLPNKNYPGEEGGCFDLLFQRAQPVVMTTGAWGGSHIHLMMDRKQTVGKALRSEYNHESQCSSSHGPSIQQMILWEYFS